MNVIRDVDHDRQPELGRRVPHGREPFIVGKEELAALVADREPEVLPDLDPRAPAAADAWRSRASRPGQPSPENEVRSS